MHQAPATREGPQIDLNIRIRPFSAAASFGTYESYITAKMGNADARGRRGSTGNAGSRSRENPLHCLKFAAEAIAAEHNGRHD